MNRGRATGLDRRAVELAVQGAAVAGAERHQANPRKEVHGTGHPTCGVAAENIQKLAMKTHLEVQQREDIRRDLAERMKFAPPDFRTGESVFLLARRAEQNSAWTEVWKMVEEILAVKGPMVVFIIGASIFQVNASKLRRPLGTPVLWLSC